MKTSAKTSDLVIEFNRMKLTGYSMINGRYSINARGENHFGDSFICLPVSRLSAQNLSIVSDFCVKHNGSFGIHPVKGKDSLCIRISGM